MKAKTKGKAISVSPKGGMHFTFPNGLTVSMQIGYGMYCENHSNEELIEGFLDSINGGYEYPKQIESDNCELAIFDSNGFRTKDFIQDLNADVAGYLSLGEAICILNKVWRYGNEL